MDAEHPVDEIDGILTEVARLLARHELGRAEHLLAPVVADPERMAGVSPSQRARILLEWGWLHGATQRYPTARVALTAAIDAAENLRPRNLLCETLREAGLVDRYEGDFAAADAHLERSEAIARADGLHLDLGQALFLRATVAHHVGAFVKARELLADARQAADRCAAGEEADQLTADILRESAVSARIARDFDRARTFLAEASNLYRRIGRRIGTANTERELGAVLEQVGDDVGARRHYAVAFTQYLRAGRRLGAAHVARRLGRLDLVVGADDPACRRIARRRFAQALRLGGGEPTNAALTTLFLGQLARFEGDLDEADRLLVAAGQTYAVIGQDRDIARDGSQVALQRGLVARARGDRATAVALFRQAIAALDVADDPSAASLAHYELAFDLIQDGHVAEAAEHAAASFWLNEDTGRRLRDPSERRTFYQSHRDTYGLALHCAARADDGRTALAVATAARSEALAAFVRAGARITPRLRDLIDDIALAAAEADRHADEPAHDRLRGMYRRLEHQTSVHLRQTMTDDRVDLDELIASLPPAGHALLLDVLEEDDRICNRIWISPDGRTTVDEVILPDRVRRYLDAYHAGTEDVAWRPQNDELADLGRATVPAPLAAILGDGVDPALVISTGGLLGPVPVAALRVNDRYLAEQARLAVVPSLTLWAALRSRPIRTGAGALTYLDPAVPGGGRELDALTADFGPVHLTDARRLRADLANAARHALVVISAHGEFPAQAVDGAGLAHAFLLGDDDRLTAAELLLCRLPDGVVMASCWSGRLAVRTAVEPLGLPAAALVAGARWVLTGSVDIGGTPTATLLATLYRELAAGRTPSVALQEAQRRYIRHRPSMPPGAWAGLAIVGDGFRPIAQTTTEGDDR